MAKKKRRGHYCRICGEWKANEKFSGKGHAAHICRECAALPLSRRNELQRIGRVAAIDAKLRLTKEEWDMLEKYAQSTSYPELKKYAAGVLAYKREMRELRRPAVEVINYSDLIALSRPRFFLRGDGCRPDRQATETDGRRCVEILHHPFPLAYRPG
jgi:hypothetical protein